MERKTYQFIVLLCISFLTFGSFWVFDTPGAIQHQLQKWFGGRDKYSNSMNLLLYSVYAYPNIVLALFGGYIMDEMLGIKISTVLFCFLVLLGQLLFALGVQSKYYLLCVFGRFVFGLGGESLSVTQTAFCARWFKPSQLILAMSVLMCISRVGATVNFLVTPLLANKGVPLSVWGGVGVCLLSFCACLLLVALDRAEKYRPRLQPVVIDEKVAAGDLRSFPVRAWLLFWDCLFFYVAVITFYSVASDIMQQTGYKFQPEAASRLLAIPNLVSLILFPPLGWVMDKYGRTLTWLLLSVVLLLGAHVMFAMTTLDLLLIHPGWVMVLFGIGYAIGACAMWPMLAIIVDPRILGTGYGLMTAFNNTGSALFPQIIGYAQDKAREHEWTYNGVSVAYALPSLIFIICSALCIVFTCMLVAVDRRSPMQINASRQQAAADDDAHKLLARDSDEYDVETASLLRPCDQQPTTIYFAPTMPITSFRTPVRSHRPRGGAALRGSYLARLGIAPQNQSATATSGLSSDQSLSHHRRPLAPQIQNPAPQHL